MRYLFYLVHPAKYHFHKFQINYLLKKGHDVDILINTKDILEDLVKEEGWNYVNIFPKSRKIKGVHVYISAIISVFRTVYRIWKFTRGKKYDLFIGDLTTVFGRLVKVPSFYPTDDVLSAVPEQAIFFKTANYIIAPYITKIGKYETKKIGYEGYKALAHLHPNNFTPDKSVLSPEFRNGEPYFIIRCTGFMATHDLYKSGISDNLLIKLKKILEPYGRIIITSERKLTPEFERYQINIKKNDIAHYMAFSRLFISDSTTMATEAAVLGVPSLEFDEYFHEIDQMGELEKRYGLVHCYRTKQEEEFLEKVQQLASKENIGEEYKRKRDIMIANTCDVSAFLVWLFENFPASVKQYYEDPELLTRFKSKRQQSAE